MFFLFYVLIMNFVPLLFDVQQVFPLLDFLLEQEDGILLYIIWLPF